MNQVLLLNGNQIHSQVGIGKLNGVKESVRKIINFFKVAGNAIFNSLMKPCSIQEQVEAARLAEMKLRRHISIM